MTSLLAESGLEERTATEVHATLCALVRTNAATHSAWAEYAAVLLGEEAAAFFESRLSGGKASSDSNPQPSKKKRKRKVERASDTAESTVPEIKLRVASLDGTTLELTVTPRELVREVKRLVGQVRRASLALPRALVDSQCHLSVALCSRATWTRA
jgi:hypothetical protein